MTRSPYSRRCDGRVPEGRCFAYGLRADRVGCVGIPCGCGQGRALLRRRFSRRQDDVVLVGYKDQEYDSDDQREVDDEDDCCLTNEYAWPLAWCATERL